MSGDAVIQRAEIPKSVGTVPTVPAPTVAPPAPIPPAVPVRSHSPAPSVEVEREKGWPSDFEPLSFGREAEVRADGQDVQFSEEPAFSEEAVPAVEPVEGRQRVFAPRSRPPGQEWGEAEAPEPEAQSGKERLRARFSGLRGRREEVADLKAAREKAGPTIRVSIGRIEIRPLADKPKAKVARPEEPSLEAYLQERRRESW